MALIAFCTYLPRCAVVVAGITLLLGCGRGTPTGGTATPQGAAEAAAWVRAPAATPRVRTSSEEELWARAKDGDADDLARLADREGATGLVERGDDAAFRDTAIGALAYADGLSALPWLAERASEDGDGATRALDTIADIAARRRRADDPEDALELRAACDKLLALARDKERPTSRRVAAIGSLRMLAERGCVRSTDIPKELDGK